MSRVPNDRYGVIRVVSAMSAVSPLYPQEPTSSVRPATSEKCQKQTSANYSISSSAVAIRDVDTLRPRALAAFWLNTSRPCWGYP
jgi:hypothetical protein